MLLGATYVVCTYVRLGPDGFGVTGSHSTWFIAATKLDGGISATPAK